MSYDLSNFDEFVSRENEILTATLFTGGDTARFATIMTGVKGKTEVPDLAGGATIQAGSCNKQSAGTTTPTLVDLEVFPWYVQEEFCQDDLENKFPKMIISRGSNDKDTLEPWQEQIVNLKVSSVNEQLENLYWQGDTASGNSELQLFDGFIKKIDTNGNAKNGNTGNVEEVTVDNILEVVESLYLALPAKVKRSGEAVVVAGDDWFELYIKALKNANLYHFDPNTMGEGEIAIAGTKGKLQRIYGLDGTGRMFAGAGSRFVIGADIDEEKNTVKIWYDETDDLVYMRIKAKSGVAVAHVEEIAEFTLVTP